MPADTAVRIRPLEPRDLDAADRVMRLAFGTFLGLPDPLAFMGDADYVRSRWRADPEAAFAAEAGGSLAGSNFATSWGSVGFFGPLTVRPDLWDAGIGQLLMEPVLACFERWGTRHAGLFTFAHSTKHVGLYQRFGFWPGHLTAIMSRAVAGSARDTAPGVSTRLSAAGRSGRDVLLAECRELTGAVHDGLDLSAEIRAVSEQGLGDTLLLRDGSRLVGLAVCHAGAGSEAGSGVCYVKFGAVQPGRAAEQDFGRLLEVCEAFAAERGAARLVAGISTARHEAYRMLLARGFRTEIQGVHMHRPSQPGYDRPGVFALDDWR